MHREQIKTELRLVGSSLADIARDLGVSKQCVSAVVSGSKRSHRIEKHIATRLGLPLQEVWPDKEPPQHMQLQLGIAESTLTPSSRHV
jgi:lambda repressor-like predicted transcriptional regulator